ncbi:3-hydroxyacyl-CoA dehydrogenase NAD-binding domain-containing protein [Actinomycetota bacterium]
MGNSQVVAVVGAGAMGAGIAQVAAVAGHETVLVDAAEGAAEAARSALTTTLEKLAHKGKLTAAQASSAVGRLRAVDAIESLPPCGLVIEAVVEDLAVKREIFARLGQTQPEDAILATNTSSLSIDDIAASVPHPERFLGLHFFNPAPVMRLVEVVRGEQTGATTLVIAESLMRSWGKTPVRCTSTPGFIVNRVARPFYGEAQRMLEAGVADAATLDAALVEAGFRIGPLALTDLIGQDVNLAVGTSVWEQTGRDERYAPTRVQQDLVAAGKLGRKSGEGIYRYAADGGSEAPEPDREVLDRIVGGPLETDPVARTIAMLVNEAVDLVHRGEASAEDVDTAMQLGTGYPWGPIAKGREIGFAQIAGQIEALDAAFPGGRYRPSPGLREQ